MGNRTHTADSPAARLIVLGLGPGRLDRILPAHRRLLDDPGRRVFVRTLRHPGAAELANQRQVESCDDIYQEGADFDQVYRQIADRVLQAAAAGPTIYAVPGSPNIGEFAVELIRQGAAENGVDLQVVSGESFVDAVLAAVSYDPLDRGIQILNGHRLPDPLAIAIPTIVAHLDLPVVLADVAARLSRVLPEEAEVILVVDAGLESQQLVSSEVDAVDAHLAGPRTSLFIDAEPGGLLGAVRTMHRLREECPWDQRQTHHSLAKNLVEETFELVEALAALPEQGEPDWARYAAVEDELGDVLLQVLFHAVIARQAGAFELDDVAETLRRKLVRRHPHVFGEVVVGSAEEVKSNWDRIKEEERGGAADSVLDDVPLSLPGLSRAAKLQRRAASVGFDWPGVEPVFSKLQEEVEELAAVLNDRLAAAEELGDVLFSVVNLSRHLEVDPELALRGSIRRFVQRFQAMEQMGSLEGLSLEELDDRWDAAKRRQP